MKTLKLLSAIAMVSVICSCEKDTIPVNENRNVSGVQPVWKLELPYYFDNGIEGYGCVGTGGNCLGEVVVYSISTWERFLWWWIENTGVDTGDDFDVTLTELSELTEFVEANSDDMNGLLGENLVDAILDGDAIMTLKGSADVNETVYLIIKDTEGEVIVVHRLDVSNIW